MRERAIRLEEIRKREQHSSPATVWGHYYSLDVPFLLAELERLRERVEYLELTAGDEIELDYSNMEREARANAPREEDG